MTILYFILTLQLIFVFGVNLFFLDRLMGYDCAATYLQVIEIWNQKTFFLENWSYTTTLTWDSPLLFAVPLYGILGNVFTAYGISILISLFLCLLVAERILDTLQATHKEKIIFAICFFTPFITYADSFNRIDYYGVMLSLLGVYTLKTAFMLLIWLVFLRLDREELQVNAAKRLIISPNQIHFNQKWFLPVLALFCCFFSALSSGLHVLLFGIVPPLLFGFTRNILRDRWDRHNLEALAFLILAVIFSVVGKTLGGTLTGYTSHESSLGLTPINLFFENLESIFQGYLALTGALPPWEGPDAFSSEGISYLFFLALSMGLLASGLGQMHTHLKKKEDTVALYFTSLFFLMLLIFVFIYTKYGSSFFEVRYLIPNFLLLLMFSSIWFGKALDGHNKSLKIALQVTVFPCLLVVNGVSYFYLEQSQNDKDLLLEIKSVVSNYESPLVYMTGLDTMIHGRNLRVFDQEKVYLWSKDGLEYRYWGEYTYFCETTEYEGETLLLSSPHDFATLPFYLQNHYEKVHDFSYLFSLYRAKTNPFDFATGLTNHEYNVDYPYSYGINHTEYGNFWDDGSFYLVGYGAYSFWGPNLPAPSGIYDITLHYDILSAPEHSELGYFLFSIDDESQVLAKNYLHREDKSVTLKNVDLNHVVGQLYEYKLCVAPEVEILVKSFEMIQVSP